MRNIRGSQLVEAGSASLLGKKPGSPDLDKPERRDKPMGRSNSEIELIHMVLKPQQQKKKTP